MTSQRHSIHKILVANRGEIALRIMRTCRDMGIATVAVFSDADQDAAFVRAADEAVRIGPAPSTESYLVADKIFAAAKLTGADAIHPGYGFLAENAAFAAACPDHGLRFIGPSPEAIRTLGSKRASKALVAAAGVPVVPGYHGEDQSAETLRTEAETIGFPVLVKASAGGGGKGMRVVSEAGALASAIESARREAAAAFGDDTLLLERYVDSPRHVEIQILGDSHGNMVHLFERECSIQRRHQKVIEETPSTALHAALRERMGQAAMDVARAVDYENAGTVEFLLGADGSFYFLEVNTRLQVEHPITECITGLDLVREQIRVARGERLTMTQADLTITGAAIECRIYAEDPDNDFLPTSGRIVEWHLPPMPGLRVDTGVVSGDEVSIHYDPMLAKIITHAPSRDEAICKMLGALRALSIQGVVTNRAFLMRVLAHPAFASGDTDTHFIATHKSDLTGQAPAEGALAAAAMATTLVDHLERKERRTVLPGLRTGFRNNRFADEWIEYECGGETHRVEYRDLGGERLRFEVDGAEHVALRPHLEESGVSFEDERGLRRRFRVARDGARRFVTWASESFALRELPRFPDREAGAAAGGCIAPMPGKVIKVLVAEGDEVTAGQTLVVLEAMKMEHPVKAAEAGIVASVSVAEGTQVDADATLVVVEPAS